MLTCSDSAAGKGTIRFGLVGAFRFVSGQVSKLASADVSMTTPVAVVGIRGTEFWGGPIDDQALGVFLIEGSVSVSNGAGQQILNLPGQGTNIAAPGAAPGPVTFWPPDKVGPRHRNGDVPVAREKSNWVTSSGLELRGVCRPRRVIRLCRPLQRTALSARQPCARRFFGNCPIRVDSPFCRAPPNIDKSRRCD